VIQEHAEHAEHAEQARRPLSTGNRWLNRERAADALWIAAVVGLYSLLALRFCGVYFPLDATKIGGPGDFEPYTAMDWIVAKSLLEHGQLPLWNPYVYSGLPFIGDAYISFFNPAIVAPLMLYGPVNGGKVAVVVAVALSGLGQYWLSRVLGQGRVVALVAGVLGLTAGTLVARIASGFNFGQTMQHAWMALTLASFIVALRTRRPGPIALAALCYALLFHAGNLYLWLVLSAIMLVFGAGYAISWKGMATTGRAGLIPLAIDWRVVQAGGAVAILGALLDAVQLLPMLAVRNGTDKPTDVTLQGTQPPLATLFDFVVADRRFWANELFGASTLGWAVHYAYIGGGIFLFLLFLVPAFRQRPSRDLVLLALTVWLTVAWAAGRHTFVWVIWQHWEPMRQLRFWGTTTHATTIVLIPLALAGADYLWRALARAGPRLDAWGPRLEWRAPAASPGAAPGAWHLGLSRVGLWVLLLFTLWRIAIDPWQVNRQLWNVVPRRTDADAVFAWLRARDPSAFTVQNNGNFTPGFASYGHIAQDMQILNSVWLFKPRLQPTAGAPDGGLFNPVPKYVVQRPDVAPLPATVLLAEVQGAAIYTGPPGLPFAFVADPLQLPYGVAAGAAALSRGQVSPAMARFDGPNRIVVRVAPDASQRLSTLVVLQSDFDGWQARAADGTSKPVQAAGGFLALTGVRPGETYVFAFHPPLFTLGAGLSLLGLLAVAVLLWQAGGGWLPAAVRGRAALARAGESSAGRLRPAAGSPAGRSPLPAAPPE
jgi:hypothetical protein